jgi:hypothetical protein
MTEFLFIVIMLFLLLTGIYSKLTYNLLWTYIYAPEEIWVTKELNRFKT